MSWYIFEALVGIAAIILNVFCLVYFMPGAWGLALVLFLILCFSLLVSE